MELIDLMAGVGGSFVGYHAVRLFGLLCFRMGAAVREWRYMRTSNVALRRAEFALERAEYALDKARDIDKRTHALENTQSPTARIAILEEQVSDLIDLSLAQTSPNHPLGEGVRAFLAKYDDKDDKKKD
jgi:Tfp pilus assembly protein PilX